MEDFVESWKHMQKAKRVHNCFLLGEQKKTGRGKECQFLDVVIHSTIAKAQLMAIFFLNSCHCPQRLTAGVT